MGLTFLRHKTSIPSLRLTFLNLKIQNYYIRLAFLRFLMVLASGGVIFGIIHPHHPKKAYYIYRYVFLF